MNFKKDINDIFNQEDKVCIITGGSGGIGSTLVNLISHNGGKVCVLDKVIKKIVIKKILISINVIYQTKKQ